MKHRDRVRAALAKYPGMSKAALARKLYEARPGDFKNVEHARAIIRKHTGASGDAARRNFRDELFDDVAIAKRYNIPDGLDSDYRPYILEADKVLVMSDIHVPFHDQRALAMAIHYGVEADCDTVLLNGDAMDCHNVSSFRKEYPDRLRFHDEVKIFRAFLDTLAGSFKQVVFKFGNHEERMEAFLATKAEELYDMPEFRLETILGLYDRGVKLVKDKRPIRFDRLTILHGHEYRGGITAPVNTARGLFLRGKSIAMQGHNHQTSEHTETTLEDKIITCWSTGCLCNLHPKYMPLNKWNLGFSVADKNAHGGFRVHNHRIINGKVY